MNIIDQYNIEMVNDTKVDELNIKDVQMKLIANKHKWASRLINAKQELAKLERLKYQALSSISQKIKQEAHIEISDISAKRAAETNETYQQVLNSIEEQKLLIEFLEKTESIMKSMTYDIKNIIDIIKMEST